MGEWDYINYNFSQANYAENLQTLYLGKPEKDSELVKAIRDYPFPVHLEEIKKIEKRSRPLKYLLLEIKPGIRARKTLSGGLEFKVDLGPGRSFEIFRLSEEEHQKIKNTPQYKMGKEKIKPDTYEVIMLKEGLLRILGENQEKEHGMKSRLEFGRELNSPYAWVSLLRI